VRVLLDTHIFITAAVEGLEGLSPKTFKLLRDTETERVLSSVSVTEIAIKSAIGKLPMNSDRVSRALADLGITLLPYTTAHAMRLFDLPLHHGDPFDRMLIATALTEDIPILSADTLFREYKGLRVIRA
jgi:PIN domain nuclease of toxin-antitoxin system